jgi:BarA-like signal transduction histidine kinase
MFLNTTYQAHNQQTGEIIENFQCTTPIDVVHYPVKDFEPTELDIDFDYDFNFLTVAQISPRKNMQIQLSGLLKNLSIKKLVWLLKVSTMNNSIVDRMHTESN